MRRKHFFRVFTDVADYQVRKNYNLGATEETILELCDVVKRFDARPADIWAALGLARNNAVMIQSKKGTGRVIEYLPDYQSEVV